MPPTGNGCSSVGPLRLSNSMSRAVTSSALALTAFLVLTIFTFGGQDRGQGRAGRGAAPANVLGDGPWDFDTEQARIRDVRVGPDGLI
jgi:hypothetical protein